KFARLEILALALPKAEEEDFQVLFPPAANDAAAIGARRRHFARQRGKSPRVRTTWRKERSQAVLGGRCQQRTASGANPVRNKNRPAVDPGRRRKDNRPSR